MVVKLGCQNGQAVNTIVILRGCPASHSHISISPALVTDALSLRTHENREYLHRYFENTKNYIFSSLHEMQTRYRDENVCPSVCQTCAL